MVKSEIKRRGMAANNRIVGPVIVHKLIDDSKINEKLSAMQALVEL